jgi:hypothetical protein
MDFRLQIFTLFCFVIFLACKPDSKEDLSGLAYLESLDSESLELDGKQLADLYCSACHLKPDPNLLDKTTWQSAVLPDMRRRLGLINADDFGLAVGEDNSAPDGVYSKKSLINQANWDKLQEYYLSFAPDSLALVYFTDEILNASPFFEPLKPILGIRRPNLTTMVKWDKQRKHLYVGDRHGQLFRFFGDKLTKYDSIAISSPAAFMKVHSDGSFDLLKMGVMDPSDYTIGTWTNYSSFEDPAPIDKLTGLVRPVHVSSAILEKGEDPSSIVSQFGNHFGKLSIYNYHGNDTIETILNTRPGTRKTVVADVNQDGLLDIVALMTQAEEGVYAYINKGNGKFLEEAWLRFDPLFGGSDFEFTDINGDGFPDLVIVNGDNADLSPILKPYHGLRIFQNNGNNSFEESYFFPFHGASGLVVDDFNQDGKMDIAAIAFFPIEQGEYRHNFLSFAQNDQGNFTVSTVAHTGHSSIMTIEKGDVNGDGKMDLILGCFDFKSRYLQPFGIWEPFIILQNTLE